VPIGSLKGGEIMKINSHDNQLPQIRQASETVRIEGNAKEQAAKSGKDDSIRISDRAREAGRITAEVRKVPDVREERVRELRAALDAGTYRVSGNDVAEKMIREQVLGTIL